MKKIIAFLIIAVALVGCIFAAGCVSTEETQDTPEIPTEVAYTVTVVKDAPGVYNIGDILEINMMENSASTGYNWKVVEGEDLLYKNFKVADLSISGEEKQPELVGASKKTTFWFQMKEEGTFPITLQYVRSWEEEENPITYADFVTVVASDRPVANGARAHVTYDSLYINPEAGAYVKVVTPANPSTGYYYKAEGEGLTIIEDFEQGDSGALGAPGNYVWYVKADKAGDYTFKATQYKAGTDEEVTYYDIPVKFN